MTAGEHRATPAQVGVVSPSRPQLHIGSALDRGDPIGARHDVAPFQAGLNARIVDRAGRRALEMNGAAGGAGYGSQVTDDQIVSQRDRVVDHPVGRQR